jgi:hypothetical protein
MLVDADAVKTHSADSSSDAHTASGAPINPWRHDARSALCIKAAPKGVRLRPDRRLGCDAPPSSVNRVGDS